MEKAVSQYVYQEAKRLEAEFALKKNTYLTMQTGEEVCFRFRGTDLNFDRDDDNTYKLYFTGEVDVPWEYRCEPQYPILYRRIHESLIEKDGAYQLRVKAEEPLPRMACYRAGHFPSTVESLSFSCAVEGAVWQGDCRFEIEVYYRNCKDRYASDRDCEIHKILPMVENAMAQCQIQTEREIDFVLVSLILDDFRGDITISSPVLTDQDGHNYLEPFSMEPRDLTHKKWMGLNLSKIEWPYFVITLNDTVIFEGIRFDRAHRWPSYQFSLPKEWIVQEENVLKIRYLADYLQPLDFILRDVSLLQAPVEQGIIACEKYAAREFGVLIRLKRDCVVTCGASRPEITPVVAEQWLPAGLQVVKFNAVPFVGNAALEICVDGKHYAALLERYIEKDGVDVMTGTGDHIYTDLTYQNMEDYLAWYLNNRLGKMLTFRTSYRWSGANLVEDGIYDWAIDLLGEYGIYTAIMTDGRELPSYVTNEKHYRGENPKFLGYQAHENDGMYLYWGGAKCKEDLLFYELAMRLFKAQGFSLSPHNQLTRSGDTYFPYYDHSFVGNMKQAATRFAEKISAVAKDASRHSGPSILFKYFFEAGVKWCCAELMYNPLEVITAALRGTSLANGQRSYGGHMAVQWSTTPHDDIYRYRRFFNALMTAYTNGIDQINTEEGCWRLEECYADLERNSSACLHHTSVQAAFADFIATHTRRGELKTNIAILHGKYDGLDMFTHPDFPVWGMQCVEKGDSEKSWDLVKVFFPHAQLASVYQHDCPHEPVGFHTGTPYGLVDIVPDNSGEEFLQKYPYLIMLGYHCADSQFNARMCSYVANGGTLLATLAHFTDCLDHQTANAGMGNVLWDKSLRELVGDLELTHTPAGQRLADSDGTVHPVLYRKVGKGRVILFNTTVYPNHESIRARYREMMETIAQKNAEGEMCKGWAETKDWVSTSVFDALDRRVIYCVNVNWWSDAEPMEWVTLHHDGYAYDLAVARDTVCIASIFGETMFVSQNMTLDVLGFDGKLLRVQGKRGDTVLVYRKGSVGSIELPYDGIFETQM